MLSFSWLSCKEILGAYRKTSGLFITPQCERVVQNFITQLSDCWPECHEHSRPDTGRHVFSWELTEKETQRLLNDSDHNALTACASSETPFRCTSTTPVRCRRARTPERCCLQQEDTEALRQHQQPRNGASVQLCRKLLLKLGNNTRKVEAICASSKAFASAECEGRSLTWFLIGSVRQTDRPRRGPGLRRGDPAERSRSEPRHGAERWGRRSGPARSHARETPETPEATGAAQRPHRGPFPPSPACARPTTAPYLLPLGRPIPEEGGNRVLCVLWVPPPRTVPRAFLPPGLSSSSLLPWQLRRRSSRGCRSASRPILAGSSELWGVPALGAQLLSRAFLWARGAAPMRGYVVEYPRLSAVCKSREGGLGFSGLLRWFLMIAFQRVKRYLGEEGTRRW